MHTFAVLLVLLAISTRAVSFFNVTYSSVDQCGPLSVGIDGSYTPELPLTLTIVPFLSEPLSIPLPNSLWNEETTSGEIRIPFLPFPVGSEFIASLDDASNQTLGFVSDVIAVQHSNNKSCLPSNLHRSSGKRLFSMHGGLSQCSRFNISFDPTKVLQIPKVRAFLPRSFSFNVNASNTPATTVQVGGHSENDNNNNKNNKNSRNDKNSREKNSRFTRNDDNDDNNQDGGNNGGDSNNSSNDNAHNITNKEYILNVIHGIQAVLLMDDGLGHRETSQLFTAGGTAGSPLNCFHFNSASNTTDDDPLPTPSADVGSTGGSTTPATSGSRHKLTKGVKVAIVLSVLSASSMIIGIAYLLIRRKRIHERQENLFKTSSFVFTEDVDMGSSFATRVRTHVSRVLSPEGPITGGVKRRYPSYRSYRDEKDDLSSYIPTSPIGSLNLPTTPRTSLVRSEKLVSWVPFTDGIVFEPSSSEKIMIAQSVTNNSATEKALPLSFLDLGKALPSLPTNQNQARTSSPELPVLTVPRDSVVSRLIFGSEYLPSIRNEKLAPPPPPLPKSISFASPQHTTTTPSYVGSSLSGYQPSTSSSSAIASNQSGTIRNSGITNHNQGTQIFISSPIRPSFDPNVTTETVSLSTISTDADVNKTGFSGPGRSLNMLGNLSSRKDPGRVNPFPTVPRRVGRSPES